MTLPEKTNWITERLPTEADAHLGYVLRTGGKMFDGIPCPLESIEPGQAWAHCVGWRVWKDEEAQQDRQREVCDSFGGEGQQWTS